MATDILSPGTRPANTPACPAAPPATAFETLWQEYRQLGLAGVADELAGGAGQHESDREHRYGRMDYIEHTIATTPVASVRDAAIQLWLAMDYWEAPTPLQSLICAEDLDRLALLDNLEWHQRYILAALKTLRAIGGEPQCERGFDAHEWIAAATRAGAALFVRDGQLWVGKLLEHDRINERRIHELRAELTPERREAVCSALAARGLSYEAEF